MATILIVDDEENIRFLMKCALGSSYGVIEAASGAEAITKYREHQPDVVVTDLNMPGMSGLELIQQIRSINAQAKIIATTGTGFLVQADDQPRPDLFLSKPISLFELEAAIEHLIK